MSYRIHKAYVTPILTISSPRHEVAQRYIVLPLSVHARVRILFKVTSNAFCCSREYSSRTLPDFYVLLKQNTLLVTKTTTLAAHRITLTRAVTLKIFVFLLSTTVVYSGCLQTSVNQCNTIYLFTVKSLNIGTCMSEQTV